ncbi:hypothetical protein [Desulfofustis limnaeus]|jgi:hypothetical protein|uniref:Uncharacterized protein n=1 Tax=Desulfofustis limnaeus TaxID=2740163 RepID=A0ABM7WBB8_9BACT|nr:hypothetical protein [Desulfofustis limnaeus]MDX9894253.1 hypothetical protein [Desulfofustis sp.]BDD88276.1 hypothetical protein DPPLL_26410 [Desulfofustis limnaeus]
MQLFLSVLAIVSAAVLFCLLLIAVRNPQPANWKSETLQANLYVPLIMAVGLIGVMSLIKYFLNLEAYGLSSYGVLAAAGVVAAGGILIKMLNIGERLRRFAEAERQAGLSPVPPRETEKQPEPPVIDRRAA